MSEATEPSEGIAGGFADPQPMTPADLNDLIDLDATIESAHAVHLEAGEPGEAEPLARTWRLEVRPLEEPRVEPNRLEAQGASSELHFLYKQVAGGTMEGTAWILRVGGAPLATLLAMPRDGEQALELMDVRVDYDERRQGFGSALVFALLSKAREDEAVRAVTATVPADNVPVQRLLSSLGFDLIGIERGRSGCSLRWRLDAE